MLGFQVGATLVVTSSTCYAKVLEEETPRKAHGASNRSVGGCEDIQKQYRAWNNWASRER